MIQTKKPMFTYGYVIVFVAFLIMLISWGTITTFGIFLKPLIKEFGWTRATASGAYTFLFILQGMLGIVMGRLNDKFGPRLIMTASGVLIGSAYLLMSQVTTVFQLYLFYGVLIGLGASSTFVPLSSTIARWFIKYRGQMTGAAVSGLGVGTTILPFAVNLLIASYGWRISYVVIGMLTLPVMIISAQFLRRDPGQMGQLAYGESEIVGDSVELQDCGFSFEEALRNRQFWMLCVLFSCHLFGQQAVLVHIVPHASDIGFSGTMAASILSIIGSLTIAGMIVMSNVGDRLGNKPALIISFVLVTLALFWLLAAREAWMLFIFAVVFGFAFGGIVALESPVVAELFGLRAHGTLFGIVVAAFTLGGGIGAFLTGKVFDITGDYSLAFIASAILSLIGLILVLLLKAPKEEGITNS